MKTPRNDLPGSSRAGSAATPARSARATARPPAAKLARRQLTLRQLEIFEVVARLGSFTRASEQLHLTQPSVSMQVKSLAQAVGHTLFDQVGRQVHLTAEGRALYETCRELDALWSRFEAQVDDVAGLRRGHLRVSVVTTAKYFLPRALGLFCRQYPGIEVELEVQNRDGILARLRDTLDDFHIMSMPPAGWAIDSEPFLDNPLVLIAPPDFKPPRGVYGLADLSAERFLLRETGSGTRMALDEYTTRHRVRLPRRMTLGSNEAIKQGVAGGLGLAVLSRHSLTHADLEGVQLLAARDFPLHGVWHIVHWHGKPLSAAASAFRDFLCEFAKDYADTLDGPSKRRSRA